jgi:hypothetical protein
MGKFGSCLLQRVLSLLSFRNVENYSERQLYAGLSIRNCEDVQMYPDQFPVLTPQLFDHLVMLSFTLSHFAEEICVNLTFAGDADV